MTECKYESRHPTRWAWNFKRRCAMLKEKSLSRHPTRWAWNFSSIVGLKAFKDACRHPTRWAWNRPKAQACRLFPIHVAIPRGGLGTSC